MTLEELLSRFDAEDSGDGWLAHCPAHADSKASLRISVGEKRILLKCRAGCSTEDVLDRADLTYYDLPEVSELGPVRRARSTSEPASAADVAALRVRLERWAAELAAGTDDGAVAEAYVERRFGLSAEDARRLGLGVTRELGGGPRVVVPFYDAEGVARGFQARAVWSETALRWIGPASPEGGSWSKVGILRGESGWDEVIVTEGPGDALTAVALGYDVVLIRGAGLASNADVQAQVADFVGDRVAVVAGDGDASGSRFSAVLARALVDRGARAKVLAMPAGEDLSSWRASDPARFTREVVRAILSAAEVTSSTAALTARDEKAYPLTDLGNARFVRDFIEAAGSGVRYSPEAGFYLLERGVWRQDRLDRTRAYVQDASAVIATIAETLLRESGSDSKALARAKKWLTWSRHSQSKLGIDAAVRELQALADVAVDVNDFDRHPHLLAVRNGVVDLRSGELLHADPALLLTRRVELDYRPDARAPRWERFLEEVFPSDPELPAYMRRLIGYGVTGSTAEQCFVVLWGKGANGKSVLTDTLTEVFREFTTTTPFSTFEERQSGGIPNDLAALKGARLVMASEGEANRRMAEAVLKRVTGRDLIAARFMRREFFEFRPTFLLLLATNAKPNFRGQDEGLWRRVKLVPFERYFAPAERDTRLGEKLLEEREGILAWAVRGAVEWYASRLQDPESIRRATEEYRETQDQLTGFLQRSDRASDFLSGAGFVVTRDDKDAVPGRVLWDSYLAWVDEEALPLRERWTRSHFFAALEERGMVKRKRNTGIVFVGVRRMRATEAVPNHDAPEDDRAELDELALSSPGPITDGPSLEGID